MSGASWPATEAAGGGRETVIQPRRAVRLRRLPSVRGRQRVRFPLLDPVREAGARTDSARRAPAGPLIATFRCAAPARCGAFADEPFQKPPCTLPARGANVLDTRQIQVAIAATWCGLNGGYPGKFRH